MTTIVTTVSTGYVHYLKTLLKSIKHHNGTKYDVVVLFHDDTRHQKCLYAFDKHEIRAIYPVEFRFVSPKQYEKFGVDNVKFFSLEAFGIEGYDRIIFLDSDILNVSPLDRLENLTGHLCMAREEKRQDTFNKGVMVIGKDNINRDLPEQLRNHEGRSGYGTDHALVS